MLSQTRIISATLTAIVDLRDGSRPRTRTFDLTTKSCANQLMEERDEALKKRYRLEPYMDADMPLAYQAADLVVCRSGAATLSELAVLGNSFATVLRLDSPEGRHGLFGVTNPPVKVSLYTNGNFAPHTLEVATGTWEPRIRPIRPHEGFAVQNLGSSNMTVRMSGELHPTGNRMTIPPGASLLAPPLPRPAPLAELLTFQAKDGMQVLWFDEQAQK